MVIIKKTVTQRIIKKSVGDVTVNVVSGLTATAFLGSNMVGAEGSGRTYTHTGTIGPRYALFLGTTDGGLMRVHPSKLSLSTTVVTNDTVTVAVWVADTDALVIET